MKYDYDIAVVGAGSGGLTVAFWLAAAGKKVALIEGGLIGGDCTNFGCVPSKALIDIAKSGQYNSLKSALKEVRKRRQLIQDEETVDKIESHGLKVIEWYASFVDDHTLHVEWAHHTHISASNIVLSTGSHAMTIDIPWVDQADILTNETVFEQTEDIQNMIVIWGGYIGSELAESIAAVWTTVHLIQRNIRLIPREEMESSQLLQDIFESKGIHVHTGANVVSAKKKKLMVRNANKTEETIPYDKILIALGRVANTEKLNLEKIGIEYDKKWIVVDKYNRTNKKHIFAIGDCVKGNFQFTHWANNEWRGVIRNILVPFPKSSVRDVTLPAVLYTHLEVARVGRAHTELCERHDPEEFVSKIIYFESNDRSKLTNDTQGFVKVHFKRLSGRILGATIFGKGAWEMLGIFTSAMDNNLSAYKLAKTIQPYPTKADIIKRVCDQFVVGTISNIKKEVSFFIRDNILQIGTALLWLGIMVAFLSYKSVHDLSFEDMALSLYNFLWAGIWWPILYILIYTIRPVVLFPGTFMTFMSGALFGFVGWLSYTLIGATFSALFAYVLWGVFGKKLLSGDDAGIIGSLKSKVDKEPFVSVLMTRLLFFPYDITNYACGFLKVKWKEFTLATFIGIIPGSAVFILAGAAFHNEKLTSFSEALQDIDVTLLYYAAGLFVITIGFAKVLKKVMADKK